MTRRALLSWGIGALLVAGCAPRQRVYFGEGSSTPRPTPPRPSGESRPAQMRPYTVAGRTYYPTVAETGSFEEGLASWYGPNFHGKQTASGEVYDQNAFTAAHKTLPMNTVVRVTHRTTGESVVVRINDRGPFVEGRIIDLSTVAGRAMGLDRTGTAPVRLEVLDFEGKVGIVATGAPKESRLLGGMMVQIGAFKIEENARTFAQTHTAVEGRYQAIIKTYSRDEFFHVMLTGFQSEAEARDLIARGRFEDAFVVAQ